MRSPKTIENNTKVRKKHFIQNMDEYRNLSSIVFATMAHCEIGEKMPCSQSNNFSLFTDSHSPIDTRDTHNITS